MARADQALIDVLQAELQELCDAIAGALVDEYGVTMAEAQTHGTVRAVHIVEVVARFRSHVEIELVALVTPEEERRV